MNGTPVPNGATKRFKWLVSLEDKNGFHFCAGTLIGEDRIATAEHCLGENKNNPKPWYAVFNKTTEDDKGGIKRKLLHYFTPKNSGQLLGREDEPFKANLSDYAEVVFEKKTPSGISPIKKCSKSLGREIKNGTWVKAVGWGDEGETKENDSKKLNEVDLNLAKTVNWTTGSRNYIYTDTVDDGVVKTHCGGDSGGPLLLNQNAGTTFCLLGTVAGTYCEVETLHDKKDCEKTLRDVCEGGAKPTHINNDQDKAYYNYVPEMTTIQNSKKDL